MYHFYHFRKKKENDIIIKLYNRRSVVLINTSILMSTVTYYVLSIGPINNVIVAYFYVAYVQVDWIALSTYVSSILVLVVIAYFSLNEMINLRFVLLISAFSFLVNSIAVVVAFVNYKFSQFLFWVNYLEESLLLCQLFLWQ